ncbi:aminopeptidase A-like [Styela clava]
MDSYEMGKSGSGSYKKDGLSRNAIFAIVAAVSVSIAVGLGVGLGVGLNKDPVIEYVYVTSTPKQPPKESTTVTTTTEAPPSGGVWENFRLPSNIIPSHYRLSLHPNMTTDDYTGTNAITFTATEATDVVIFHAHRTLNITSVQIQKDNAGTLEDIEIKREFRYPDNEFYVVQTVDNMAAGEYILTIGFNNSLIESIVGIYKSTYTDPDGTVKGIVGSDMEPVDARRGYPCFDEPALKITYTTSIVHEAHHTALSNMPDVETTDYEGGLKETLFQKSVPMPTYLGCFIVGEIVSIEATSKRGIPLKIYGTKAQIDAGQADYALNVTKVAFDYFEELFMMNYSLPKLDQIAIPNFGTGAMENWGLVTYRETNLLWDQKESSTYYKQRVAAVISHELVHQWFGNIVTMKWWDNIWLNEGFASYLEYLGENVAEPTWGILDHLVNDDLQSVMRSDSSLASHPIVVDVNTPSQITSVFDSVTYSKGATVLYMLHGILGDDLFFGGINKYLNDFRFSNANEQDLWNSLQTYIDANGGGYDVKEMMDPWVQQMGFPVITVGAASGNVAQAKQEHMLADANPDLSKRPPSVYDYKWMVKVDYFRSDDTTVKEMWLNRNDTSIDLDVSSLPSDGWIKVNVKEKGYYRVNYSPDIWRNIAAQLESNFTVFSDLDRSNILDDGFNLAPAGRIEYVQALNLTTYLDEEKSFFPWDAFADGSSYIRVMLQDTDAYPNFKKYYLSKVKPIADELGWDATVGTHNQKRMRPTILALALRYDDVDALNNATDLYTRWRAGEYIHPDIRQLVYRYGITGGDESDWEYMLGKYLEETVAAEKLNLLRGLAATEDVALIDRLLEYSKNESIIKQQDFFTCINYISYGVNGNVMAWNWVQLNWEYLVDRFGIEDRSFGRMIPNIVDDYNTELLLWEVESFFERYPEAGAGETGRANTILQINLNIAWMAAHESSISNWLAEQLA